MGLLRKSRKHSVRYFCHFEFQPQSLIPLLRREGGRNGVDPFVAVPPKLDLKSVSDMEKKGKVRLSSGQSIKPTPFFLRRWWEHEDLVVFLESVGEIEEFGFLGDEGGLPIGCLRELRLEIGDLVLE